MRYDWSNYDKAEHLPMKNMGKHRQNRTTKQIEEEIKTIEKRFIEDQAFLKKIRIYRNMYTAQKEIKDN